MEFMIILVLLAAFTFLAARYGHDSRDSVANKEQEFARHGYTWDTLLYEQQLAEEIDAARRERRSQPGDLPEAA
jgi:hypothetical protein